MKFDVRYLVCGVLIAASSFGIWRWATAYFDNAVPIVVIKGIESDAFYAGELSCSIDSSRTGEVSMWLDDKPLVNHFKVSKHDASCPFIIPTNSLVDGKHLLKVLFTDNSFYRNKVTIERTFNVDNILLKAAIVTTDSEFKVFQGRTLHVQFQANKPLRLAKIMALSGEYICPAESKGSLIYEAFVPIACEEKPNEYLFSIEAADHVGNISRLESKFQVLAYPFKKQSIVIDPAKIKEEDNLGKTPQELQNVIDCLTEQSPQDKLWRGAFCTPIDIQRITCDFGTIRTTQHKGRYVHKALDVINAPKSIVWSTQDGIVVAMDRFSSSGKTVIVDHGLGLLSLFFHLDEFAKIAVGQRIAKGSPVGTIGKTGEATGYHLHWEMRLANIQIDPMQWTRMVL